MEIAQLAGTEAAGIAGLGIAALGLVGLVLRYHFSYCERRDGQEAEKDKAVNAHLEIMAGTIRELTTAVSQLTAFVQGAGRGPP